MKIQKLIIFFVVLLFVSSDLFAVDKNIKITNYNNFIEISYTDFNGYSKVYLIPKSRIESIHGSSGGRSSFNLYITWEKTSQSKQIMLNLSDFNELKKYYESIRNCLSK